MYVCVCVYAQTFVLFTELCDVEFTIATLYYTYHWRTIFVKHVLVFFFCIEINNMNAVVFFIITHRIYRLFWLNALL